MRKLIFRFIFLSTISTVGYAQQFSLNHKLLVHLGYSAIKSNTLINQDYGYMMGGEPNSKYSIELGYKIIPSLSLSAYFASSSIRVNYFEGNSQTGYTSSATSKKSSFYGLDARFHLLPLFTTKERLKIDAYIIGTLGQVSTWTYPLQPTDDLWQKIYEEPFWEKGLGLGLSYNFTKNIGIFGEYQLGHFYNNRKSQWKAGVLVTF